MRQNPDTVDLILWMAIGVLALWIMAKLNNLTPETVFKSLDKAAAKVIYQDIEGIKWAGTTENKGVLPITCEYDWTNWEWSGQFGNWQFGPKIVCHDALGRLTDRNGVLI